MNFSYNGNNKYCCICEHEVDKFMPWKHYSYNPFTRSLLMVGSDTLNFYCPICNCNDRERHLWLYVTQLDLLNHLKSKDILCISLDDLASRLSKITDNIIIGDVNTGQYNARIKYVDLTDLVFPDNSFDLIVANHVLEHIVDYEKALHEVYRTLKAGGLAILQTPYSTAIYNNFEDPLINTDFLRDKYYGQKDHVRIVGLRLFDDLLSTGFEVFKINHNQLLSEYDFRVYGVNPAEDLILVRKPDFIK